jgi:hypothetical protein
MNLGKIYWNCHYGWRAGSPYVDPQATASDLILFEYYEYENDLDVPDFLLDELDRQHYTARDIIWVCRTRQDAQRYSGPGVGQPHKEEFGPHALILATDHEPETGCLVLFDASRLDSAVLERYGQYRQTH